MTPKPAVDGLPEGVDFVKLGVPSTADYYIVNESDGKGAMVAKIIRGMRVGVNVGAATVVVKPADGWAFRPDIRDLGAYVPVKLLPAPLEITATVKYQVTNSYDQDFVQQSLDRLKQVPGFMSIEQQ